MCFGLMINNILTVHGYSIRRISRELDISPNTVRNIQRQVTRYPARKIRIKIIWLYELLVYTQQISGKRAMNINIRRLKTQAILALRQKLLRPEHSLDECRFAEDNDDMTSHFGAYTGKLLIGIVTVFPENFPDALNGDICSSAWRLRAMATLPQLRGLGIGRDLVSHCSAYVIFQGGSLLWCNARSHAVKFYEKCGFQQYGDEFDIDRIGPHYCMLKKLH